jgi:hypothetical protein
MQLRWFGDKGYALIHHRCRHPQMRDLLEVDNWFACERPEISVDAKTVFEAHCPSCEARWVAEGAEFWNGPHLSDSAAQLMLEEAARWGEIGNLQAARWACEQVMSANADFAPRAEELLGRLSNQ